MRSTETLNLTIALPTRSRPQLAQAALARVVEQLKPGDELVVVDNGSAEHEVRALRDWLERACPAARLVVEPRRGVSFARNTALAEAANAIVCFIDDDTLPEPGWLEALRRRWHGAQGSVGAIGGPMAARWESARPAWLADYLLYVVSVLELGDAWRRLQVRPGECLWGGNLSVRRDVALAVGAFVADDVYLDAVGDASTSRGLLTTARSGEEEDLQHRLVEAGYEVWYEPTAAVQHRVASDRLSTQFFRRFFRQKGVLAAASGESRAAAIPVVARAVARLAVLTLARRPEAPTATFTLSYAWGLLTGSRRRVSQPPAGPVAPRERTTTART